MKADTGQLQEFLKLNDISAMVMSIASRSFSMENEREVMLTIMAITGDITDSVA